MPSVTALRRKMDLYQANGGRLGWLLLPQERVVEIWRGGQQGVAERLENASGWIGASWWTGWRWIWRRSGRCDLSDLFRRED